MPDEPHEITLWRYSVIASLLHMDPGRGALKRAIAALTVKTFDHPTRGSIQIGFGTIEEWLYRYRRLGIDGLEPKPRKDRGHSRKIDDRVQDLIEDLAKQESPRLDGRGIHQALSRELGEGHAPSLSSVYRFLRAKGLDQRHAPARRDHRAYAFELAGDCWQGDVMYGPGVPTVTGSRRRTYLIAIIDDATRVIVHAQFYFEQHLRSLKDCLKQALQKRGLPRRFYFDNGKIFRSRMMLKLAARLGIHLIHSAPYRPQGRAKIERWFRTVRLTLLARRDLQAIVDLDQLNGVLWEWIEGEYHRQPHRGLDGDTPLDRWVRLSEGIRPLPPHTDLDQVFYEECTRRVHKDGTLAIRGGRFEAGPAFIGKKVTVLFDSFDLRTVLIKDERDQLLRIFPVDLHRNRRVRRNRPEDTDHADQ